jgi:tRNA A-37 threonylcarbamoyl transferase component Bud32
MGNSAENLEKHLNRKIEELRAKMIEEANKNGMNHPSVIKYSEQLDDCMNKLLKKEMCC